jgi:hypothetical protein
MITNTITEKGKKEKPLESISQGPGWNSGEGEETLRKEKNPIKWSSPSWRFRGETPETLNL